MNDITAIDITILSNVTGGKSAPTSYPSWEQTLQIFKSLRPGKPVIPQHMNDKLFNWNRLTPDQAAPKPPQQINDQLFNWNRLTPG